MQDRAEEQPVPASAYDLFAWIYDHFFAGDALNLTVHALESLVFPCISSGCEVLDLCCGTGRLTKVLASRGYRVTGIDNSAQMLDLARSRVPQANFLQADIRDFELQPRFEAVVCAYNSLPHITGAGELARVFQCVRNCLRDSGIFVFDLFSRSAYIQRWRGSFARVEDDCVCLVRAGFDPETARGENLITIFQRNGDWKRSDLKLTTRCYTDAELRPMLAESGFQDCRQHHLGEHFGVEANGRMFWRCVAGV